MSPRLWVVAICGRHALRASLLAVEIFLTKQKDKGEEEHEDDNGGKDHAIFAVHGKGEAAANTLAMAGRQARVEYVHETIHCADEYYDAPNPNVDSAVLGRSLGLLVLGVMKEA